MYQHVRLVVLAAVAAVTSACETVRDLEAQSRVDPQTIATYRLSDARHDCPVFATGRYANTSMKNANLNDRGPGDNHTGSVPLDCFSFPAERASAYTTAATAEGDAYSKAVGTAKAGEEAKYARNRLASVLLKQSDDICTVEMGRLVSRDAMVNTSLSIGNSALSGASTVATGELAKSILSAGAGLLNASRESMNANVYRNVMSTAVAKAIEKERDRQRADILTRFDDDTINYPVDRMVMEVNKYHQACSFYHGLGLVLEAVSRDENTSEFARLSGEVAAVKDEIRDLEARQDKAGEKEKQEIDAELAAKRQMLAKLQEGRTRLIMPAAVEKKTEEKK